VGDVIPVDETLTTLPPLQTVIKFGKKAKEGVSIPVKVEAHYTEMGTLALWCQSLKSPHRWRFQFQLRTIEQPVEVSDQEVLEESLVNEAISRIKTPSPENPPKPLFPASSKTSQKRFNTPKEKWPLNSFAEWPMNSWIWPQTRKRGIEYESRWLNLIGFCLRPGFGDALDEHRIEKLWKSFHDGVFHQERPGEIGMVGTVAPDRRGSFGQPAAPGLLEDIVALKTREGGQETQPCAPGRMELWMTLANLERLSQDDKAARGKQLLKTLHPKKSRPQHWWSLSRIAAREPLYGPIDRVLSPGLVTSWIKTILSNNGKTHNPWEWP
jgi:hypothetical protein